MLYDLYCTAKEEVQNMRKTGGDGPLLLTAASKGAPKADKGASSSSSSSPRSPGECWARGAQVVWARGGGHSAPPSGSSCRSDGF